MSSPVQDNEKIIRRLYQEVSLKMLPCGEAADFAKYSVCGQSGCLDDFGKSLARIYECTCDCKLTIKHICSKEDRVMVHYTVSGTQKNDFMGADAIGEKVVISGVDIFRVVDGKIVEHWGASHQLAVLR